MSEKPCEKCKLRKKFDQNPRSLIGRLWRWHIGWCPGWKSYMRSLPEQERDEIKQRYGLP